MVSGLRVRGPAETIIWTNPLEVKANTDVESFVLLHVRVLRHETREKLGPSFLVSLQKHANQERSG